MAKTQAPGPTGAVPFEEFYAAYYPRAVRYATPFVGSNRAEDVAQCVMLRLLRGYHRIDPARCAWNLVMVATRHECFSTQRRLTKRELVELAAVEATLTSGIDTTAHEVLARDDWRRVARALMALPRADREVLVSHVWYGVSLADLARRDGVAATTMRQRVSRLRRQVARALDGSDHP